MIVAAALENGLVKPITRRGRPDASRLPPGERRRTTPATSAFPSGHIGAATAFAVASARETATLRRFLAATAVAVAYARVYTGRHHPSDAVVGAVMGAVAGSLVHRLPVQAPQLIRGGRTVAH